MNQVGSTRSLQLVQLFILRKVVEVCDKHNIEYFLHYGTLLGAVRHKGFIPWDDDIDIAMKRDDYNLFLQIAQSELGDEFFIQHYTTDSNYPRYIIKVRLVGTEHKEYSVEDISMNHGVYIDIFPLDKVPVSRGSSLIYRKKMLKMLHIFIATKKGSKERTSQLKTIARFLFNPVFQLFNDSFIYKQIEKIYSATSNKKGDYWASFASPYGIEKDVIAEADIGKGSYVDFEGEKFKIPSDYDIILSMLYGDYMTLPPKDKRIVHDIVGLDLGKYSGLIETTDNKNI